MILALILAGGGALLTFAAGFAFAHHASQARLDELRAAQDETLAQRQSELDESVRLQKSAESRERDAEAQRRQTERALGLDRAPLTAPQTLQSLVGSTSARAAVLADVEGLEWAGVGEPAHRERLASLGVTATSFNDDDILVLRSRGGDALVLAAVGKRALVFHRGIHEQGLFAFERSLVELRRGRPTPLRRSLPLPLRPPSAFLKTLETRLQASGARSLVALGTEHHEGSDIGVQAPSASDVAALEHLFKTGPMLNLGPITSVEWCRPSGSMLVVPASGFLLAAAFERYALDDVQAQRIESLIATQALKEAA